MGEHLKVDDTTSRPFPFRGGLMQRIVSLLVGLGLLGWAVSPARPCTRFLWNNNKLGVFSGRTMDWPESTDPRLWIFPRGLHRDGGKIGDQTIESDHPARWTSKYGSIVTSVYGVGSADGFNEKGLGMHMLYLSATQFEPRDKSKPGVHAGLWGQYLLDQTATVAEAVAAMEKIQVVLAEARGHQATVHLALEDATGDSAIFEFVGGKLVVHHGRQYPIMTNDPTFDQQLELLKKQDFSNPSSDTPLPGNVRATDRFQRVAYFAGMLPEPKSEREAIAGVLAIVRNASVPFGAPYKKFGIYNTEYRTAMNLTDRRYFFELTTSPNVIWLQASKFDFAEGAQVLMLDPDNINLSGDVSAQFQPVPKAPY
jgi:choloylglycine hydrolase